MKTNKGRWRPFPSSANAKIWIGEGDTLRSALGLYHPYSRYGRAATEIFALATAFLGNALLGGHPDDALAARFDRFASLIRDALGDSRLTISFSPGTPGPHQKVTAQVSRSGTTVAYVKVAENDGVRSLLHNEAEMLSWLHQQAIDAVVLPEVIELKRHDELTLLFLGAPPQRAQWGPLEVDNRDLALLTALAALPGEQVPLTRVFEDMNISAVIDRLQIENAAQAALIAETVEALHAGPGRNGVHLCACHGDYAPWNTLRLAEGQLYVFDWEYGSRVAPLLSDALYRLTMPARLVRGWPWRRTLTRLMTLPDHPIFAPLVQATGLGRGAFSAYLLLFLLKGCLREWQDRTDSFYSSCLRAFQDVSRPPLRRLKVLISAYACEPDKGSEPGVGWNVAQQISRDYEAWVVTKENNREPIEKTLALRPNPNLHFVYVGLPRWLSFWKKGPRGVRIYYYIWQFAAWRAVRKLGRDIEFDLAHHVTFAIDAAFSFLALLPYPFVWGPIGSNALCPRALLPDWRSAIEDRLRYGFRTVMRTVDPLLWLCAFRAALIVGISPDIGRKFPLSWIEREKFLVAPAIAVDEIPARSRKAPRAPLRIIFVGHLIFLKGPHLALHAFARFAHNHGAAELRFVGDGPMRAELVRLAADLGVSHCVHFRGWLRREESLEEMAQADIFLFPSGEGGGMVVLEAMAHGVPVVCLNYGGPGQMVSDETGIRVKLGSFMDTMIELASALAQLANDEDLRSRLGAKAHYSVNARFLWDSRRCDIIRWYAATLCQSRYGLLSIDE